MANCIGDFRPGVLCKQQIHKLSDAGYIRSAEKFGYASLDLRLGDKYWKMKGGIKGRKNLAYTDVLADSEFWEDTDSFTKKLIQPSETYVFKLLEEINFPADSDIEGYATGKSSVGRLDVLTRLIADRWATYEEVPAATNGNHCNLYLEVTPITFPIIVRSGLALSQLRFFKGAPPLSRINDDELALFPRMLFYDNTEDFEQEETEYKNLRLNLSPVSNPQGAVAFRAKKSGDDKDVLDLGAGNGTIPPNTFWEPIACTKSKILKIEPESFYILRSLERFKLPRDIAVYGHAVAETLGELRIHYAGFVHPNFGSVRPDGRGAPLIFEVRGHNVTTFLRHGEIMAKISFYRMSEGYDLTEKERDDEIKAGYEKQELSLSKIFSPWE
jgi:dCTP deaminase